MFPDVKLSESLITWLVFTVPGIFAWPLIRRAFPGFPDGGYGIARSVGLVLWCYFCWLLPSLTPIQYGTPLVWITLIGWVGVGSYVAFCDRHTLSALWKEVLCVEAVFLITMLIWLAITPYNSEVIPTQERFMDYAYMSRLQHTTSFPPLDGWMSGKTVQYYYYGYILMDVARRVSSIELERFLSYGLVANFAMFATAAYGAGYAVSRKRWLGVSTVALALFAGNLHMWVEWIKGASDIGMQWFYAARIMKGTITEFPLFSMTFGDFHPYVLGFPIVMSSIALAVTCWQTPSPLGNPLAASPNWKRFFLTSLLIAVVVGALFPTNSWDYPTFGGAVFAAIFISTWLASDHSKSIQRLTTALVAAGGAAVASVILYLPFNLTFGVQQGSRGLSLVTQRSDMHEMLIHWGPFLVLTALYVWATRPQWRKWIGGVGIAAVGIMIFELSGHGWILIAVLLCALIIGLKGKELRASEQTAVLCAGLGLLVILGVEIVHLDDHYLGEHERMNTVFKTYLQAWLLLSVAIPVLLYTALRHIKLRSLRWGALGVISICIIGMSGYPTLGAWFRYGRFQHTTSGGEPTMNALSAFSRQDLTEDDAVAANWVNDNLPPDAIIIEATDSSYGWTPRISTFTGRLSVIGWMSHEAGWRNDWSEPMERDRDVNEIYKSADIKKALHLCRKYKADYLYIGKSELNRYDRIVLEKFLQWQVVYSQDSVKIYKIPGS